MIRLLICRLLGLCSCDRRFVDIANDWHCPVHGIKAQTRDRW